VKIACGRVRHIDDVHRPEDHHETQSDGQRYAKQWGRGKEIGFYQFPFCLIIEIAM
jgi:hypothetical protein